MTNKYRVITSVLIFIIFIITISFTIAYNNIRYNNDSGKVWFKLLEESSYLHNYKNPEFFKANSNYIIFKCDNKFYTINKKTKDIDEVNKLSIDFYFR